MTDYYRVEEPLLTKKVILVPKVAYLFRLCSAAIGVGLGVIATVVFSGAVAPDFLNPWAAALGAGSAIVAAVTFVDHRRHEGAENAGKLVTDYSALLRLLAIVSGCVGAAGMLGFLMSGLFNNEELTANSPYIAAIWGSFLAKWGVLLLYYTNSYGKREELRAESLSATRGSSLA